MAIEPNTGLTLWPSGAIQQDLLFNAMLLYLNSGFKGGVQDKDLNTPPTLNNTTDVGKCYIVGSSPTGLWSGKALQVTYWTGLNWVFWVPREGFSVAVFDEDIDYRYSGSVWLPSMGSVSSVNGLTGAVVLGGELIAEPVNSLSSSSGVVNINCAIGDYFTFTLTENISSITFSNLPASGKAQTIFIRIRQDGSGGWTVNLPSSFKASGGSDTSVQPGVNAYTLLAITTFDQGTRWEYTMQEGAA